MALHIEKLDKRDLRKLELFCEIVEQGGISNATVSTGLSQPVLSNQLISLEGSLGVTLCKRGRSGFELTEEGHLVYGYANELSALLSEFASKLNGVQSKLTGHVRIGCLDNTVSLQHNPLTQAIEAFYQLSDAVEITLEVGDFTVLHEKLLKNQLDMMIVVLTEHNTNRFEHVVPLFTEQSCLYARRDRAEQLAARHYDLEGERINIGGYAVETMCQLLALDQYQKIHVVDGWHVESSLMLTRAGTHLSFLPTHLIDNHINHYDLVALQPKRWQFQSQFSVVLKCEEKRLSPAARAFFHTLQSHSQFKSDIQSTSE
ncbi:HTH-type transcriptional regulator CynR [Vibrio stylophorae]|uniref:HTH-type transcriptional regulator CynR n=1 Tax=Vibrio stylophorae TaxID=659351 RepID=A0ABM8ZTI5_9VIBR|nr:LysR family transcriptional regulator [Vibrio stylophorae]CAH0533604.1 HTH-type transcriptional regulator CynR [Vibrio stylophorae]